MLVEKTPKEIFENPFSLIGDDWMLLTATKRDGSFNTMTASWGGLGVLWGKPVLYCFIRPQRYTHEFSEAGDTLTASFFSPDYKKTLAFCGKYSGRDVDKIKETGLTPVREGDAVYFEEAKLVLVGKKLYRDSIRPEGVVEPSIFDNYLAKDYHTVYVFEIKKVLSCE